MNRTAAITAGITTASTTAITVTVRAVLAASATVGLSAAPVLAQTAITGDCPLLVPASQRDLQPKRLPPEQVAEKNARGCLSPFDGIYGPDGCPAKLCGPDAGVIPLPATS